MDTFKLKILAISAMLLDSIGIILINNNSWLYFACRCIGTISFPVFAFLITEGFLHTGDMKKYLKRLFTFSFLSEIPYDLAFYRFHFNIDPFTDIRYVFRDTAYSNTVLIRLNKHQNIFFTLFLGLSLIILFDMVEKKFKKDTFTDILISNSLDAALTVFFCALAYILHSDYSIAGILMIAAFYLFKESKPLMTISLFVIAGALLCNYADYTNTGNLMYIIGILSVLAMIPIILYNGKKGKDIKYFFYAFYPLHLLCLFMIGVFI